LGDSRKQQQETETPMQIMPSPAQRLWFVKIAFGIDTAVNAFLHSCGHSDRFSDVEFDEFERRLRKIREGIMDSNYNVYMTPQFREKNHPEHILFTDYLSNKDSNNKDKNQKNNNNNNNNNKQNNKNNNSKGNNKAITNPTLNQEWANITRGFKVALYLSQKDNSNPTPTHNSKTFCVMYHGLGRCNRGHNCQNEHTCPTKVGKGKEFTEFLQKMVASKTDT
jgi:hypothetical protein